LIQKKIVSGNNNVFFFNFASNKLFIVLFSFVV